MAKLISPTPTSALHEILKWSIDRPVWQKDALRRIVARPALNDTDIGELDRLCRAAHKADKSTDPPVVANPLDATHLGPAPGITSAVSLVSIGELKRVGKIPDDQTMPFGPAPGLTAIYGDNGTGKSGFARVLRKACKTRGQPSAIASDVFAAPSSGKATAKIVCQIAGMDAILPWTDGDPVHHDLAQIFVFDTDTAEHYLAQDEPAAFTPYGLDVLPRLVACCSVINSRIESDISTLKLALATTATNWKPPASTKVSALVVGLSGSTTQAQIDELAHLDAQQKQRLKDLGAALKDDAKLNAMKTRGDAARLKAFATKVAAAERDLGDTPTDSLRELIKDAQSTAKDAKAFASKQFDKSYLSGTGGKTWLALWEAARNYSNVEVYKDPYFPVVVEKSRCVLCQQDLETEAKKRLTFLEAFCKDQSQQLAFDAAQRLATATDAINKIQPLSAAEFDIELYADVSTPEHRRVVSEFVARADARLAAIQRALESNTLAVLAALPLSPAAILAEMELALDVRAKTEESAADEATRVTLKAEHDELLAREWLIRAKADVMTQVQRHKDKAELEACQKDTSSTSATIKSKDVTKEFVSDKFCKAFEKEVDALGLSTVAVRWEEIKGKKGEVRFGPRLVGASGHPINEVASEGEQRCISLAAFLAELSQAGHKSALIFDDPVSSLDQRHRLNIAARLVSEATDRQVIVFSHDILFVHDLIAKAEEAKQKPRVLSLEWDNGRPGKVIEGLSWDCAKPKARLNDLKTIQVGIAKRWNPVPNAANAAEMREAYSKLRATVEGIIERELLAGVICRFDSQVYSGKLKKLVGIPQSEVDEADRLLQRCHDVTNAHYGALGKHAAIPVPAELLKDIDAAEAFRKISNARSNP